MSIFNTTFTSDKPIYYPSNWQSGKTADELYEEWKQTSQFFILTNFLQCLCAGIWLFLLFIVFSSVWQLFRIYRLPDDNREKMHNKKFIKTGFLTTTGFISISALIVTIGFLYDEFIRYALFKGGASIIIGLFSYWAYKTVKAKRLQLKLKRNAYTKISKQKSQYQLNQQSNM